jgi:lipopolysaccharide/colanic/teichoic acid biosynthesis glycosyltransferase
MSTEPQPLEPVTSPAEIVGDGEAWAQVLEDAPCWPVTRLVAAGLTLLLGVMILGPVAVARARGLDWLALLLPAIVATLSARALFEALMSAGLSRGLPRHLACALVPTALAVGVIAVAATIVGLGFTPAIAGVTAGATLSTLTAAGGARDLEIRVRLSLRRVYLIGSPASQRDLARELSRRHDASLVGAAAAEGPADRAMLVETIRAARPTIVVLDHAAMQRPDLVDVAATLNLSGMHIRDLVSYYESEFKKVPLEELSPTWFLFDIVPIHRRLIYHRVRRGTELLICAVLLLIALPLLAIAAVAITLTSPGPVLYRQRRVGRGGEPFTLIKLRTMAITDATEATWAGSEAARITPVGRFLRRFRLDEVPQLWNVIRGDLALIGPRPEQLAIVERLDRELPHYSARHCIRPGITGWAQVTLGYAGSAEGTVAKLQRDLYYIKHSSLRLDGLILWLTFRTVISGRG